MAYCFQMLKITLLSLVIVSLSRPQMVDQCQCTPFNECLETAVTSVTACADKCQSHLTSLGASYPAAKQCVIAHLEKIKEAVSCARTSFGDICSNSAGQSVPRRYPETMQLAAFREINAILTRSGVLSQATAFLQAGRRAAGCLVKCGQTNSCVRKLDCGLALPADNIIVSNVKKCLIQSGFNTPVVREICHCLADAGVRQITNICDKLVIS